MFSHFTANTENSLMRKTQHANVCVGTMKCYLVKQNFEFINRSYNQGQLRIPYSRKEKLHSYLVCKNYYYYSTHLSVAHALTKV